MKLSRANRPGYATVVKRIRTGGNIVAALVAALQGAPEPTPAEVGTWATLVGWVHSWGWVILVGCIVVGTGGCTLWLHRTGDPRILAILNEVLVRFRQSVFGHAPGRLGANRVTLFTYRRLAFRVIFCRRWPPWGGWLVPVARPGHTSQRSKTVFRVPDDDSKAEGIAGQAWVANRGLAFALNLPKVTADSPDHVTEQYARRTSVSPERVRKAKRHSRSIVGFKIEKPAGEPWGVLVLDSLQPTIDSKKAGSAYRNHSKVLGRIVEEL